MTWHALIPFAASLLCLEVGIAFALIYAKVTRRKADLIFCILAFGLTWVRWASFMRRYAAGAVGERVLTWGEVQTGIHWIRLEWAGGFLALALFFHFVSATIDRPLGRRTLLLVYAMAAALVASLWQDWMIRTPSVPVRFDDLEPGARGLALPYVTGALLVAATFGLALVLRRTPPKGITLSPLAEHRTHTFVAGMVLILAPAAAVLAGHLPATRGLSVQSIAAVAFCVIIVRALGKEILRAEREKRRLADLAEFRSRAVRDVAHELKNPLTAIQMATQTVIQGVQHGLEPAAQCEMLEMCLDACRRLNRLINNMLDTARMEAGRDVVTRAEDTDVPELVGSVVAFQQNTTVIHRLRLDCEMETRVVRLDADKMHQVLANLIHNAIKYSPDGGDITVRLWEEGGRIGVSVADHGIGMTPEQQGRLFQPFARVVDPERKITGTGIGLHLVKRLVEAQGGGIGVESRYGEGSTFTVMLPIEPPGEPGAEEASAHG